MTNPSPQNSISSTRKFMPDFYAWAGYSFLLIPWIWLAMDGNKPRYVLLFSAVPAWLAIMMLGLLPRVFSNGLWFVLLAAYTALARANSRFNTSTLEWRDFVLIGISAVGTGVLFGAARRFKVDKPASLALLTMAIGGTVSAFLVQQVAGAGGVGLAQMQGDEAVRMNFESGTKIFGIWGDANIIIGVIPLTISILCYLPFMILRPHSVITWMATPFLLLGMYCDVNVATRTTFVASLLATITTFALLLGGRAERKKMFRMILLGLFIISVAFTLALPRIEVLTEPIRQRFGQIQDDSRIETWIESWNLIWRNPTGGGSYQLSSHNWAHNVILESGLVTGLAGMVIMVLLHGVFVWRIVGAVRAGLVTQDSVLAVLISFSLGHVVCSMLLAPLWVFPLVLMVCSTACLTAIELEYKARTAAPVRRATIADPIIGLGLRGRRPSAS